MRGRDGIGPVVAMLVSSALALAPGPANAVNLPPPAAPKPPAAGKTTPDEPLVVAYKGKMVDESKKPVSGVFPMTFKLYPGLASKKAMWTESMWVAVDRGVYTVRLGDRKALPKGQDLTKLTLGIEVRGVGELDRDVFVAAPVKEASATVPAGPTSAGVAGTGPAKVPAHAGGVKYADTAGYAVEADHAKNADRLQNLTLEDVLRKVGEEGGGGGGGGAAAGGGKTVKIGTARRFGNHIGGPGGVSEYNETCPKGYIMVGIKGMNGNFLDSIQIVCAPLE